MDAIFLPSPELNIKKWLSLTVDRTERSLCLESRRSSLTPPKLPGMDIALMFEGKKEKQIQ
jgi:hypothetical protein